jgi:hypothetical protein
MDTFGVVSIFLVIVLLLALSQAQLAWTFPVVRARLNATWPMYPDASAEGFADLQSAQGITTPELEKWLPAPESLTKPAGTDCPNNLYSAGPYEAGVGKPFKSYDLLSDWLKGKPEPRVAEGPTAQACYKVDWARQLELGGTYAQRTNNYQHGYPDSCSAPNHDLVLDFYIPKPSGAIHS